LDDEKEINYIDLASKKWLIAIIRLKSILKLKINIKIDFNK
jgi:hypothetical protein